VIARIRIDVAPKVRRDIPDAGLNTSRLRSTKSSGEQGERVEGDKWKASRAGIAVFEALPRRHFM
jgi:hypothetical protein